MEPGGRGSRPRHEPTDGESPRTWRNLGRKAKSAGQRSRETSGINAEPAAALRSEQEKSPDVTVQFIAGERRREKAKREQGRTSPELMGCRGGVLIKGGRGSAPIYSLEGNPFAILYRSLGVKISAT